MDNKSKNSFKENLRQENLGSTGTLNVEKDHDIISDFFNESVRKYEIGFGILEPKESMVKEVREFNINKNGDLGVFIYNCKINRNEIIGKKIVLKDKNDKNLWIARVREIPHKVLIFKGDKQSDNEGDTYIADRVINQNNIVKSNVNIKCMVEDNESIISILELRVEDESFRIHEDNKYKELKSKEKLQFQVDNSLEEKNNRNELKTFEEYKNEISNGGFDIKDLRDVDKMLASNKNNESKKQQNKQEIEKMKKGKNDDVKIQKEKSLAEVASTKVIDEKDSIKARNNDINKENLGDNIVSENNMISTELKHYINDGAERITKSLIEELIFKSPVKIENNKKSDKDMDGYVKIMLSTKETIIMINQKDEIETKISCGEGIMPLERVFSHIMK